METPHIHGHEIIALVAQYPGGLPMARLTDIVARDFGTGARFVTCSADNMTLQELMAFLAARDKVAIRGDRVFPGGSPACDHG